MGSRAGLDNLSTALCVGAGRVTGLGRSNSRHSAGRQPLINAPARLGGMHPGELPKSVAAMGIAGGIGKLFSTHPSIEERIAALQNASAAQHS